MTIDHITTTQGGAARGCGSLAFICAGNFQPRQLAFRQPAKFKYPIRPLQTAPGRPRIFHLATPPPPRTTRRDYTNRGSLQASQGCVAMLLADRPVSSRLHGVSGVKTTKCHDREVGSARRSAANAASSRLVAFRNEVRRRIALDDPLPSVQLESVRQDRREMRAHHCRWLSCTVRYCGGPAICRTSVCAGGMYRRGNSYFMAWLSC